MSNLIPAPGHSPILASSIQPVQVRELNNTAVGDEIDLRELWRALKRRKRVVGATFVAILILSGCYTAYQRIFRPVYEGSFQLLITDPISDENRGATGGGEIVSNSMNGSDKEEGQKNITKIISNLAKETIIQKEI